MALVKGKGTILKLTISAVLTAIAQLIELDIGAQDPETFDSKTLGGGVFEQDATGYASQGDITGNYFYDATNATHQFIASNSLTPGTEVAGNVTMADSGSTEIDFDAAAIGVGQTSFRMNNGVVQGFTIKCADMVSYPTS